MLSIIQCDMKKVIFLSIALVFFQAYQISAQSKVSMKNNSSSVKLIDYLDVNQDGTFTVQKGVKHSFENGKLLINDAKKQNTVTVDCGVASCCFLRRNPYGVYYCEETCSGCKMTINELTESGQMARMNASTVKNGKMNTQSTNTNATNTSTVNKPVSGSINISDVYFKMKNNQYQLKPGWSIRPSGSNRAVLEPNPVLHPNTSAVEIDCGCCKVITVSREGETEPVVFYCELVSCSEEPCDPKPLAPSQVPDARPSLQAEGMHVPTKVKQ